MKVLIAEDNESSLALLESLFRASGYEVESAENGKQALAIAQESLPDLIISDILMPEMDGFAFCQAVKKDKNLESIPFVFYTATYTDTKDERYAMSLGASRYLIKPMEVSVLLDEIEQVVREDEKTVSPKPLPDEFEMERGHAEILAKKLEKKIKDLETEREKITQVKKEWEKTFQAIDDSIIILDLQMRVVRCNLATGSFVDSDSQILVGKYCYELFDHGTEPCKACPVMGTIQDMRPHAAEVEHKNRDKTCLVSSSPLFDDEGKLINIVCSSKDVTKLRSLEKKLLQSQKMEAIGTLAGGIAHDFNNILSVILGYAELAQNTQDAEALKKDLDKIIHASMRAKDLVNQILVFSRQGDSELKPLKIQLILKETFKFLRASIPTTIVIRQEIAPDCRPVLANSTLMHQIIMNLCTNAYQSMKESGGTLEVALENVELSSDLMINQILLIQGEYVKLRVSDTGCGISDGDLAKIFEPYFTTKPKGEGTGLGLAVVHGIVSDLGGQILVDSAIGKGTSFQLYLPAIKEPEEDIQKNDIKPLPSGNERVLLVDDDKDIVTVFVMLLERLGYKVTASTRSLDALNLFRKTPDDFDVVITDMTMPDMLGDQLAREILRINPQTPIIICTGFSEKITQDKAGAIGVKGLLMKPVASSELARTLREVLENTSV